MKNTRILAFILIGLAVVLTGFGGIMDMVAGRPARCRCGCPMCANNRCAASVYGGSCPCRGAGGGLYVSKHHLWNDGLFLILVAIVLLLL